MTPEVLIPSAIGMSLLASLAIAGNLMTVIAYVRDRRLHTVYDFYIFNLAIADLLIGSFSMPFYAWYTLDEFTWHLGRTFCKAWLVVDFTLCFETILLMLLLSSDRLLMLCLGPVYSSKVTLRKAYVLVAISWIVSFLLYGPSIIGWDAWHGHSIVEHMDCDVEFAHSYAYTTISAMLEFVLPFVILTILNAVIYFKIRKRLKISNIPRPSPEGASVSILPDPDQSQRIQDGDSVTSATKTNTPRIRFRDRLSVANFNIGSLGKKILKPSSRFRTRKDRASSRVKRESKSARFLAILVIVFLLCWTPYTVITIVISFCQYDCVAISWYESTNWILWLKSAINPFLYATNSSRYRYNFRQFMFCLKKDVAVVSIETTVQTVG